MLMVISLNTGRIMYSSLMELLEIDHNLYTALP